LSGLAAGVEGPCAGAAPTAGRGTEPLARAVFAALVIACFAAFFVTQRLKHTPTAVQRFERTPTFSPTGPAAHDLEEISFKLAKADEVTVAIVDSSGDVVATLVRDHPVARYKQFSLRWNGRRGSARRYGRQTTPAGRSVLVAENEGALAPPGEYRVRVTLVHQGRTVLSPWSFTLEGPRG
jgi:hypothetical protein